MRNVPAALAIAPIISMMMMGQNNKELLFSIKAVMEMDANDDEPIDNISTVLD